MLGINMEFWIGLGSIAAAILIMNVICWGIKPKDHSKAL